MEILIWPNISVCVFTRPDFALRTELKHVECRSLLNFSQRHFTN